MRAVKIKTEIRRDQIAVAALELMARGGPSSLSMAALARKVGVVPSALYRHYPGKDAVLDAVLGLVARRLEENLLAVRRETPDALERLRRLLRRHVELIRRHAAIPRIIFSEEIFAGHARRRRRVHTIIQSYLRRVAEFVSAGQRAGRLRPDAHPPTVAVMFLGLIQPAVILRLMSNGVFDVTAHVKRAWPLFRHALQTEGALDTNTPIHAGKTGKARKEQSQ